jgi:hypothetical protein
VTRTVVVGGMPGWQIALIAAGAALLTAMLAVLADRVRARTTRPPRRPEGGQAGLGQRRRDGNESTPRQG